LFKKKLEIVAFFLLNESLYKHLNIFTQAVVFDLVF